MIVGLRINSKANDVEFTVKQRVMILDETLEFYGLRMARKFHDRWFEDYELTLKIPVSINS